jgi:hypothetical protein
MPTVRIVPALDELEHGRLRLGRCAEPPVREQLALECREETLAHRIVVQSPTLPMAVVRPRLGNAVRTRSTCIDNLDQNGESPQWAAVARPPCSVRRVPARSAGESPWPAYDTPAPDIEHDGEIEKACPGSKTFTTRRDDERL